MIEYKLSLASSGAVKTPGSMDALQLGYSRNCGVYRLRVSTADEWKGMTLRAFWHTPGGSPPASLVEDGVVEVPALVTAVPGEGCITFEGSDGVRTLTVPTCATGWPQTPAQRTALCRRRALRHGSSWWVSWKRPVPTWRRALRGPRRPRAARRTAPLLRPAA